MYIAHLKTLQINQMKKAIVFALMLMTTYVGFSQVSTDNSNTVEHYVQNVLLGAGITVSNITFNGGNANVVNNSVGEFTDPTSTIGLPNGFAMGSGDIDLASTPNNSGTSSQGGGGAAGQDADLSGIATNTLFDQCIVEFDFIPVGDTISFNFVFASEEYPEYVCSSYNDVFGFFLTGTNPSGGNYTAQNIALVPNPSSPGTFTNTAVAINTVNPGTAGTFGANGTCNAIDPNWQSYNVFYQTNTSGGSPSYTYDGRTTSLPVVAAVVCGETYHIKLAIADAGDGGYDSGVFLEAGSFSANGTLDATTADVPNNIQLCGSPFNVTFNTGPNPPPASYWDLGDGTTYTNLDTVYHTYADSGTYTVMYVADDPSPCVLPDTAYFTVDVVQIGTLDAQINIPPYNPCQDSLTVQLEFTGSGADSLYWDMGNGTTFINDTLINYTYTTNGNYVITFEAFDFACGGSNVITDTINFNPVFTAVQATNPGDQEFCGAPFDVDFTAGGTPPPNNYWDFGDGSGNSNLPNVTYTYGDTGSYTVMYVAIDSNTCNVADTAYFNINLAPAEELSAQFTIPPYNDCQDSLTINLQFTGTGADSLYWDMGDGTTYINDVMFSHPYTNPGDYIVTFEAYDFQCNHTETFTDTVHFNPVFSQVTTNIDPTVDICGANLIVNFSSGNPTPPQNYWDFGDGTNSTAIDPAHTYPLAGTYNGLFVAIDSSTCNIADSLPFTVTINQVPELDVNFEYVPPVPCEAVNYVVDLKAAAIGADSIYWNMGDGMEFFNDTTVLYEYALPGTYPITVVLFKDGCPPKTFNSSATFIELGETTGIIPNVFTPNGDDWNDELVFVGVDHTENYSIKIFDRWGRMAFESTNPDDNWDGDGSSEGTYFYELRYTDVCSSEEKLVTGTVTLLRGPKK